MQTQIAPIPTPPPSPPPKDPSSALSKLPAPVRVFIRPMLYLSIGLHVLLLLLPLKSESDQPKVPKEKTVKITQLPPTTKSGVKKSLVKSSPLPVAVVRPTAPRQTSIPAIASVRSRAVDSAQPASSPELTPQPSAQSPQSSADDQAGDSDSPLSSFPHFPGAQPGCLGIPSCYAVGKALASVSTFFEQELPKKGYKIQNEPSEEGRKVYQITSKDGATQFLSIIADSTSTFYVLAPEPRTMADLQNTVQVPPEFTNNILAQLPIPTDPSDPAATKTDPTTDDFASPNLFYSKLGGQDAEGYDVVPEANSEIDSMKLVPAQAPSQLYASFFIPSLQNGGFASTEIADGYGGGTLYQIKKGSSKPFYLNLVPTQNGSTIVIIWRSQPT